LESDFSVKSPTPSCKTDAHGSWSGSTFVTAGGDLMTVRSSGHLELRGDDWDRKRGVTRTGDGAWLCKMGSVALARGVVKELARILFEERAQPAI
jgi:hypothetical protein